MKECSRNDAEAAVTRDLKAAAKDNPTSSTAGCNSVNNGARVTALVEPSGQARMMALYMLRVVDFF